MDQPRSSPTAPDVGRDPGRDVREDPGESIAPGVATDSSADRVDISVVIPCLNEVDSILELQDRLCDALAETERSFEIIFVDDGSTDGTAAQIAEACGRSSNTHAIVLRRNFGKAAALQAGFDQVRGDLIFTIDGDLQDDPSDIPKFLEQIESGYDLVSGWKVDRQDPMSRRLVSKVFNSVLKMSFGVRLHDVNCGFKCYRREITEEVQLYGELHRFVPILAHYLGFRVTEVPIKHHRRAHGKSKYGISRLPKGFFDLQTVMLITRYIHRPLHYFGMIGAIVWVVGCLILMYLSVLWFMGTSIEARPLFFLGVLAVITGVQIACTGLLAEILIRVADQKTVYSVKHRIGNQATCSGSSPPDLGA